MASIFETLNGINVNDKTEQKNGLTYLSWAWAWGEVKKVVPDATYTVYERQTDFGPVNYFTDGRTCWVKTGVTLNGLEHVEMLPVMDFKNRSISAEAVTSTDVNKAIQRSLTKACARHGLGLYIYAGEDLPECERDENTEVKPEPPMPRTGSAEAAQEAGKKKLEELNRKAQEAAQNPNGSPVNIPANPVRSHATDEQIAYIRENADGKTLRSAMEAFGPNMENMTQAQANKLIARIKEKESA